MERKHKCPHCGKICLSGGGLARHISRTPTCEEAQRRSVGSSTRRVEEPLDGDFVRRSKRIKKDQLEQQERANDRSRNDDVSVAESQAAVPDVAIWIATGKVT